MQRKMNNGTLPVRPKTMGSERVLAQLRLTALLVGRDGFCFIIVAYISLYHLVPV